jgi:hypothetical protein
MRAFATTLAALTLGLFARGAAAQWGPPRELPSAATSPAPAVEGSSDASALVVDPARLREIREQVFANESLHLSGARIIRGDVPMHVTTFYALVGRPDLNQSIRERRVAKVIVLVTGAVITGIGVSWGVIDVIGTGLDNTLSRPWTCGSSDPDPKCADRSHASTIPWAVAAGGVLVLITGAALRTDPLGPREKSLLIDDYNRLLRASMKLSGALDAAKRTATVRATVLPGGPSGMLLATCAF